MPVSTSVHLSQCLHHIIPLGPRSVLDVGCGFGTWGFLCRTYLDVFQGRIQPESWEVTIDGIELFEPYIQPHHRSLYSAITIGDIRDLAGSVEPHELIICGDVIEHLEKDEGQAVLDTLYAKATRALLLNIPLGTGWEHPEAYGNPGELHRSQWEYEDIERFPAETTEFQLPNGKYGVFFCAKEVEPGLMHMGSVNAAERRAQKGDVDGALAQLEGVLRADPGHQNAVVVSVDLLYRRGRLEDGNEVLRNAVNADPAFHFARLALAKALNAQGHREEALNHIQALLQMQELPKDTLDAARQLSEALLKG